MVTEDFIREHRDADVYALALQRGRYPQVDIDFALRQIEGYQRAKEKLPTLAEKEGWRFPARLNIEQCSSEVTARYKSSLVEGDSLADLTGGYGIDSYYLSEKFKHIDYVEQQSELCRTAEHNFRLTARAIAVHNADALDYLQTMAPVDCIYMDPARRGKKGEKVVRLEECQPDVTSIYSLLRERCRVLLLKLSPMLDLDMALRALPAAEEVHIVEVNGEVKELLVLCRFGGHRSLSIKAVQLTGTVSRTFCFTLDEEKESVCVMASRLERYLYEPSPSILKAGAFKTISSRYGIAKLARNTHLYTSDELITSFAGRIFEVITLTQKAAIRGRQVNLITRNYPETTTALHRSLQLRDGGEQYLIGTRLGAQPVMILANRVQ